MKSLLATSLVVLSVFAALAPTAASARPLNRSVEVFNEGRHAVYSIEISHIDDDDWGPDALRNSVIPAGESLQVRPRTHNGYCRFDLLVTFTNDRELKLWDVNMCSVRYIYVNERGWDAY